MNGDTKGPGRQRLQVTCSPHVFHPDSVSRIMWEVNLALLPALFTAFWVFGARALVVTGCSIMGAFFGEFLVQVFFMKKPHSLLDGSAFLTGLLMAFCVPAALPAWVAFVGGFIATVFGKQVFGGLGQNIFNPAHVARAILLASWPVFMTTWLKPGVDAGFWALPSSLDGLTAATPLGLYKETFRNPELMTSLQASGTTLLNYVFTELHLSWGDLLLGKMGGSLGETGKLGLLLGAAFLFVRGHITWPVPAAMIGTAFLGALVAHGSLSMAFFHLLTGGLIIGAFFMATDMVTCPMTPVGQIIFGVGCGAITLLIRLKGGYPEGVCYSILIMNSLVPLIDRFTIPRTFGEVAPVPQEAKA